MFHPHLLNTMSGENGGLLSNGKTVTWKLKQGVKWRDGEPFTADDVVFN